MEESRSHQPTRDEKKGVLISVYVESPTILSRNPNKDRLKRIKPDPLAKKPQAACSRRSQLLSYARELRDSQKNKSQVQVQQQLQESNAANSGSKLKNWRWFMSLARLRRKKKTWNYIAQTDRAGWKCRSVFCGKLRAALKGLFVCGSRR